MSNNQDNGNAAALRDAVVALLDAMDSLGCDENTAALAAFVPGMEDSSAKCLAAFRKAKDALSAPARPARNCDKYRTHDEALKAWGHRLKNFGEWLFDPAEERRQ